MKPIKKASISFGLWRRQARQRMGLFALCAACLGFLTGQVLDVGRLAELIPFLLIFMLFPTMLEIDRQRVALVFRKPRILLLSLLVNFLVCPLLLWGLIALLAPHQPGYVLVGLALFGLVPCGGMVPAYTSMMGGNGSLALGILAISLVLSLVAVPIWAKLLIGSLVPVPVGLIMIYLLVVVILPLALAVVTRKIYLERKTGAQFEAFKEKLKAMAPFGLFVLPFIIFAKNASNLSNHPGLILAALPPAALYLLAIMALTSLLACKTAGQSQREVALVFGGSTKNTALAIALAASAFGDREALIVAISGSMVQLPLMLMFLKAGRRWFKSAQHG